MRDVGKRVAAEGNSVLVPNPFYRVAKAPFSDASKFNFQNPDDMAKLRPLILESEYNVYRFQKDLSYLPPPPK